MTSPVFAYHYDEARQVSMLFAGDFSNGRVMLYEVDSTLNVEEMPLPIPYGVAWLATDLDQDGSLDLVLQRGDPGFGGDGYLDILSAPDWTLRAHFVFAQSKVFMHPVAAEIDGDRFQELYLTPNSMGGFSQAVLVDYDSVTGEFTIVASAEAPVNTGGPSATGDFDSDGRVEFITGSTWGYGLYEYDGDSLRFIDIIPSRLPNEQTFSAASVRPYPDGELHALLGHSSFANGYRYQLYRGIADNGFQLVHEFQKITNTSGSHVCAGLDVDCDGLDELVLSFSPLLEVMEWDDVLQAFVPGCTWSRNDLGIFTQYVATDLDQDGAMEWSTINPLNVFRTFEDDRCLLPCSCPCEGDPMCDSLTDLLDVVNVISVAFLEVTPAHEPQCPRAHTDVDCNGVTDVLDVVRFVNTAFRNEDPVTYFCHSCE